MKQKSKPKTFRDWFYKDYNWLIIFFAIETILYLFVKDTIWTANPFSWQLVGGILLLTEYMYLFLIGNENKDTNVSFRLAALLKGIAVVVALLIGGVGLVGLFAVQDILEHILRLFKIEYTYFIVSIGLYLVVNWLMANKILSRNKKKSKGGKQK